MPDVNNVYQLIALLIVGLLQLYTQQGVKKLSSQQTKLKTEIEGTRAEMFRLANISGAPLLRSEGREAGLTATIEAALKVAYIQGKIDGVKDDEPYPETRIHQAARTLASHALQGAPVTPMVESMRPAPPVSVDESAP